MSIRNVTLSEIEATIRKVAQTKGLGWGLSEEAGKCARWLAAYDLPGPELALDYLSSIEPETYPQHAPIPKGGNWLD